ncbi:MAG TPA: SAM-dependent chlorinase/fluorinase [Candidatus Hydrogenedentes bacterium]|nr:SAM-dependent chlorinase/fluorinase [Candidatus Hydrogenedentota bacterium]
MRPPLLTLTTDFGTADGYVAQVKGVLRALVPEAMVDDLAHDLPPHDVMAAALFLEGAIPRYPEGSVHVVVVDPGVGTSRRPIVVDWRGRLIVGPDNGLISLLARKYPPGAVYAIRLPCPLPGVPLRLSHTFHGRDLFAPVAAYLARGGDPSRLGPPVADPVCLAFPEPVTLATGEVIGEVIHVDRFGNAVTSIDGAMIPETSLGRTFQVVVDPPDHDPVQARFVRVYGDGKGEELLALVNSGNRLELAVSSGSASHRWNLVPGARVRVLPITG